MLGPFPMLHTLHVRNLALIESAELVLDGGLNVISGETGGGKSLLIAALKLLRGEKAPAGLVRNGADEMQVDGEFRLGGGERSRAVARLVDELCGGAVEDDLLLVTRIVDAHGKSRCRIGGRPATLAALRTLGEHLVEIHGQGDSRALMRPEIQSETLDAFAGTSPLRLQFAEQLAEARRANEALQEAVAGAHQHRQRVEFLRFQQQQMQELQLGEGELAALEQEHQVLANLDGVRQGLQVALRLLQDDESCAADLLGQASRQLRGVSDVDRRLEGAADDLATVEDLVANVCRNVQSGLARLDLDPARLAEVESRLDAIQTALKRFGPTEADFRKKLAEVGHELTKVERQGDEEALAKAQKLSLAAAATTGRKLLRARRKAAEPFAARIVAELQDLGMAHTVVRAAVADEFVDEDLLMKATEHGPVAVDIEVKINPGEPFRSMRETASGGELARIVLAIKKTLADQDRVPLLVLDEIDAEIGGRLGLQVGHKLGEVASHHQVVIVTHLPQVAAFADRHFLVKKEIDKKGKAERTRSSVEALAGPQIERELAAMAGDGGDAATLEQARSLVRKVRSGRKRPSSSDGKGGNAAAAG
jgi:DNA repair protein RecN (Recombination protein N)